METVQCLVGRKAWTMVTFSIRFFFFSFCVLQVHGYVHMPVHVCGSQSLTPGTFSNRSLPLLLRWHLSQNPELSFCPGLAGQQAQGAFCLHLPSTGITGMHHRAWLFNMGVWGLNSNSQACTTSPFMMEPISQPPLVAVAVESCL